MQIGVIGINHKVAEVSLRERIANAFQIHFGSENPFISGSFTLLSTCNRSELYFSSTDLTETHQEVVRVLKTHIAEPFEQKLYSFFGMDCFLHLAKVTAGLDSAIVAETEIQGQVKNSYKNSTAHSKCSKDQHFLFQKSLKIAREARKGFQDVKNLPDLEHILLHAAKEYFCSCLLGSALPAPLFIGASAINIKIARFFKSKGISSITICNRSAQVERFVQEDLQATFLPWSELSTSWNKFDWVICATKCPDHILHTSENSSTNKKLLIDLSVPRNISPEVQSATIKLLNIDDLQNLLENRVHALQQTVHLAEEIIEKKVHRLIQNFHKNKRAQALPLHAI